MCPRKADALNERPACRVARQARGGNAPISVEQRTEHVGEPPARQESALRQKMHLVPLHHHLEGWEVNKLPVRQHELRDGLRYAEFLGDVLQWARQRGLA